MSKKALIACGFALAALAVLPATSALARGPHGPGGRGFGGPGFGPLMIEVLDLTEEQQARIDALRESTFGERDAMREQAAQLHQELRALWAADEPDREAILAKMAEMDGQRQQQRVKMVDFRLAVREILTPEQRQKLSELQAKAPGHGRQAGPRHGFGGKW
jgi:Spy/CpxP family protein refolding chaperone